MYVDNILGIGDCKTVEKVIRNSRRLEEDKRFQRQQPTSGGTVRSSDLQIVVNIFF